MTRETDLLIVGGGAAGLSAGLYAARSRIDTLLLERMGPGGQLVNVDRVENYPGFPDGIAGHELGPLMAQQAMDAGLAFAYGEAQALRPGAGADGRHLVETDGETFAACAVILAGGSTLARLGVPGEQEFEGRGVSYCATCDGEFFRDRPVVVVGGGDSALDEALYLAEIASSVTIVHRRLSFRGARVMQERILGHPKCRVLWNATVGAIVGEETVSGVELTTGEGASRLDAGGVFIYVGLNPNTAWLQGAVDLDGGGHVVSDGRLQSSVPGVFVAGDLRQFSARQVAASVGDGATAAIWVERFLRGPEAR
ncbi:MAG TPA: FAD-dependent oxidoreductase [Dehalococcoidia bacterium]|nr:FAD-dependent oxidoreductase [Dehalococcoidia bacterium]